MSTDPCCAFWVIIDMPALEIAPAKPPTRIIVTGPPAMDRVPTNPPRAIRATPPMYALLSHIHFLGSFQAAFASAFTLPHRSFASCQISIALFATPKAVLLTQPAIPEGLLYFSKSSTDTGDKPHGSTNKTGLPPTSENGSAPQPTPTGAAKGSGAVKRPTRESTTRVPNTSKPVEPSTTPEAAETPTSESGNTGAPPVAEAP